MLLIPAIIAIEPDPLNLPGSYFWGAIALLVLAVAAVLIRVLASWRRR
jgi:hypothetical protein